MAAHGAAPRLRMAVRTHLRRDWNENVADSPVRDSDLPLVKSTTRVVGMFEVWAERSRQLGFQPPRWLCSDVTDIISEEYQRLSGAGCVELQLLRTSWTFPVAKLSLNDKTPAGQGEAREGGRENQTNGWYSCGQANTVTYASNYSSSGK